MSASDPWYAKVYGETYYQNHRDEMTPEVTAAEADGVMALLGLTPGARVLDLCCGQGRHSIELARRGCRVTGLDLSGYLLDRAREAAAAAGADIAWIQADMREIPTPAHPYDAVINLFSAFGYLEDDAEEAKVLRGVARVLVPGGQVLIDTANREIFLRRWMPQRWREKPDGALQADHLRFDILTGKLHVRELVIAPDGRRTEESYVYRLWTYTELAALLSGTGLMETAPYGDFSGSRYTWDSYRLIVTARKPQ